MVSFVGRVSRRSALLIVAAVTVAAGIAYASVPDSAGVYTACRSNANGGIRVIDPSQGSSAPLGRCTPAETPITWNQQGPPGADGASPTVAQLGTGDPNCPAGGAAITDAAGHTAYACSAGPTFTSPNGEFSIDVADDGITLRGPSSSVVVAVDGITVDTAGALHVRSSGAMTMRSNSTLDLRGGTATSVRSDGTFNLESSLDAMVKAGGTLDLKGAATILEAPGQTAVAGTTVSLNGGAGCSSAARRGDGVSTTPGGVGTITGGSSSVCIGP